jgi:CRP-like cAMP-binding protein
MRCYPVPRLAFRRRLRQGVDIVNARPVSGVHLLDALPQAERDLLASRMQEVTLPEGESLARPGDFGWAMYTIVEGSVDVLAGDGSQIATLGSGDIFGEIALLRAGRRTATVVARTPLRVRALFIRDFLQIRPEVPQFEQELRNLIDARLAQP